MAFKREKVVRSAEKYVAKGKLEAAIKEYRKVLRENPNDTNTLNRVGDLYARLERYDEAVRLFSQIAEKYTEDGFFVKAIAIYKKIIKFDPGALSVYERLGDLYHRQGLTNEARSQYQFLADYYTKNDNHTSATTAYQRLTEIEPDNPSPKLKLAELYENQRLLEKSAREYHGLAELLLDGDSPDDAVKFFAKALELQPDDVALVRLGVGSLHDKGHMGAAANLLAKAVELNPEAQAVAEEIGLGEAGDEAEAEEEVGPEDETAPGTADETFEIGEEEFADLDDEAAEAMAAVDAASDEDFYTEDETIASATGAEPVEAPGEEVADEEVELDVDLEVELDEDVEPVEAPEAPEELDLEVDFGDMAEFEVGEEAEPVEAAADLGEVELEVELDETVDVAEPVEVASEVAAEVEESDEPPPVRREEDLLAEAKVFGKYGLESKARDRLEELLESNPEHLEALLMVTRMELDAGDADAAVAYAERMRDAGHAAGETDLWNELRGDLAAHGITVEDKMPPAAAPEAAPPAAAEATEEAVSEEPAPEPSEPEPAAAPVAEESTPEPSAPEPAAPEPAAPEPSAPEPSAPEPAHEPAAEPAAAGAPGAPKKRKSSDRIAQLLEDLSLDSFDAPAKARKKRVAEPAAEVAQEAAPAVAEPAETEEAEEAEPAAAPAAETPGVESPQPEPEPEPQAEPEPEPHVESEPVEPAPAAAAEEGGLFSLKDELDLGDVVDEEDVAAAEPVEAAVPGAEAGASSLDDSGMSWLDEEEPAAAEAAAAADADEDLFDEEDDFFDLAAELEEELGAEELAKVDAGTSSLESQEGSLEDIIEGFKKGVSDHLSEEDFDTHFNLGIAYREMGLLDEAIGEFQLASKDPRYLAECASMLGMCFTEKGLPQLAVRWYKKGLDADQLDEDATLGLLYDLGNAYVSLGEPESAYRTFVEIYGMNTGFRDVATKMEELAPQGQA